VVVRRVKMEEFVAVIILQEEDNDLLDYCFSESAMGILKIIKDYTTPGLYEDI
jgi:hypothetical protein